MINTILMIMNCILGLVIITLSTSVSKLLGKCNPSQKLVDCLQGLTIIGTLLFAVGISFLLASFRCDACGDYIMPSAGLHSVLYLILGITLVTLSGIIKSEDKDLKCDSKSLTTSMITIGSVMIATAICLMCWVIYTMTPSYQAKQMLQNSISAVDSGFGKYKSRHY